MVRTMTPLPILLIFFIFLLISCEGSQAGVRTSSSASAHRRGRLQVSSFGLHDYHSHRCWRWSHERIARKEDRFSRASQLNSLLKYPTFV